MPRLSLPIDPFLTEITGAFSKHENVILTAPPGSGKTTRVPAALLEKFKKIIVLVPRRIAAIGSAHRIAEENGYSLENEVGYQVRFENRANRSTRLIFMTEGVFIKKLADPHLWQDLELIIFDEFHERSSHLDLALGLCLEKQILGEKIKMLVMSATLNTQKLKNYLPDSKLIEIPSAPHPLEIIYSKKAQRLSCDQLFVQHLMETLSEAVKKSKKDILVFLPGLSEIRFCERHILEKFKSFETRILHGSISLQEQKQVLTPSSERRIILATNIAESSITIPGVDCVIDSGLEKKSVKEAKIGFSRLELNRISLFSATQRAGRAARTGPGTAFKLWHETDERSMPEQIVPEIVKSDLLEESLTLYALGVENPDQFSWLDKPQKTFKEALAQLKNWNLLGTEKGNLVQSCPLDLERSLLFIELCQKGLLKEASRFLAFLETTNFDKLHEMPDIESLPLTDLGRKIESQLLRFGITGKGSDSFKTALIHIFFKDFPNKIAKKKEKLQAISSLGRGIELASYLVQTDADYFLLLSGRELSAAVTKCDFAVGFSQEEFEKFSRDVITVTTEINFDTEKRRLYKTEKKMAGYFTLSESQRTYIDDGTQFKSYFLSHLDDFLKLHEHYSDYIQKIGFLKKKKDLIGLSDGDFDFDLNLKELLDTVTSSDEFFATNLFELLLYATPENIKKYLQQLPGHFHLPCGKNPKVDYESEQAPKISARIQEFFGQATTPSVLNGKIPMTLELLAPNYRPTQVTSRLEDFWKGSYFEVRKELKARYPKHPWPDDPANAKYEPRKK